MTTERQRTTSTITQVTGTAYEIGRGRCSFRYQSPPRPKSPPPRLSKGHLAHWQVFLLVWVFVCFAIMLFWPSCARAQEFGGCWSGGIYCAGPSATVTVGELNLATGKFSGGVSPGLGYGVTWQPGRWYATGLAGYLAFAVGGGAANQARASFLLSFANYVRVGAGVSLTERDVGGMLSQWSLLLGIGSDFGASPGYLRESKP
jgi:hypothetical protein